VLTQRKTEADGQMVWRTSLDHIRFQSFGQVLIAGPTTPGNNLIWFPGSPSHGKFELEIQFQV
jgi:hypothetical protein